MNKVEQMRQRCYDAYADHKKDIEKCPLNHLFTRCDCEACRKAQSSHKSYTRTEIAFEQALREEIVKERRKIALDKPLTLK